LETFSVGIVFDISYAKVQYTRASSGNLNYKTGNFFIKKTLLM